MNCHTLINPLVLLLGLATALPASESAMTRAPAFSPGVGALLTTIPAPAHASLATGHLFSGEIKSEYLDEAPGQTFALIEVQATNLAPSHHVAINGNKVALPTSKRPKLFRLPLACNPDVCRLEIIDDESGQSIAFRKFHAQPYLGYYWEIPLPSEHLAKVSGDPRLPSSHDPTNKKDESAVAEKASLPLMPTASVMSIDATIAALNQAKAHLLAAQRECQTLMQEPTPQNLLADAYDEKARLENQKNLAKEHLNQLRADKKSLVDTGRDSTAASAAVLKAEMHFAELQNAEFAIRGKIITLRANSEVYKRELGKARKKVEAIEKENKLIWADAHYNLTKAEHQGNSAIEEAKNKLNP
ncbi:MAG: hypothetical protein R3C01_12770 [Planctomycetaceae bacterium]